MAHKLIFTACTGFVYLLTSLLFVANAEQASTELLDQVILQVTEEQWISTQTAEITVSIDVSLDEQDMSAARQKIMDNLNEVGKGDWNVIQFDRREDTSGLQRLYLRAQARIDEPLLATAYSKVDDLSAPGTNYRVESINFSPGLIEIEQARSDLRMKIYAQANREIERLQKDFSPQKFSMHLVNFDVDMRVLPMAKGSGAESMMMARVDQAPISVSNKLTMTATIILAATRQNTAES
ncbi:MAG: hypothetical protein V3V61_03340 [Gammaproteobacteria bacterium]